MAPDDLPFEWGKEQQLFAERCAREESAPQSLPRLEDSFELLADFRRDRSIRIPDRMDR
jgi:hypothetical protein